VPLVPKAVDVLHVLIEHRGRIVEKGDLMRLVWPDATVEETGLARNISLLRKALGEEAEEYIETVPKRGYRFVAPSAAEAPESPRASRRWMFVSLGVFALVVAGVYWQFFFPGPYLRTGSEAADIAVLPFEPLSAGVDPRFPRALNETTVAAVSKLEGVRVLSPSTVDRYRQSNVPPHLMARLLGMDVTLEGSIQQSHGRWTVTARMADVHTGKIIWSGTFDADGDSAAAQSNIASAISAGIAPHLAVQSAFRPVRRP
jgi:TolB-like protein